MLSDQQKTFLHHMVVHQNIAWRVLTDADVCAMWLSQVELTRQGLPKKTLQAVRLLLAPQDLYKQHSVADFQKQVDALHETSSLQVTLGLSICFSAWLIAVVPLA